mmetsp:Transcript_54539/g.160380  ORF Transcript_54539/g.160380 Transcript_54539/m.160380 type:complete len:169 (-) Transcript_54539:97-603(-)
MKPDWDKLSAEFADSKTVVIADVDCTAGGKSLCEEIGVRGYPTIKFGDPHNLEDYKGGRDLASLVKHAEENLGPTCGPANPELCDAEKKKLLDGFMAMSGADLQKKITEQDEIMAKADKDVEDTLKSLQAEYEEGKKKKDATEKAIKDAGLGMMKAVHAHKVSSKEEL